jgi:nucleotide-binding universal stress UspA family protein
MIVCATRGGHTSEAAQDLAIRLAQENDEELVFLYVADTGVLARTSDRRPHEIAHDLTRLGEFILTIAQERAEAAGVRHVRWEVRLGSMRQEVRKYIEEAGADKLVLGRPVSQGGAQVFSPSGLVNFAAELQAQTGVEVFMPESGPEE